MTQQPVVDIIICVHNALEDVKACIQSARQTEFSAGTFNLILIDDGSDAPTADYLKTVSDQAQNITLIRREKAGGYTVAANTGLRASQADFCAMLNSDTIVPRAWLDKIITIFNQKPDVGIVGPLSNAASWQSVPDISNPSGGWAVNTVPEGWSVDDMDTCIADCVQDGDIFPRVPLLNGFCFVIRRAITDRVGYMDEDGFPRGFGEEDDFCMRCGVAGFGIVIAINTYVFHAKSKSYGSETRNALSAKGQAMLKKKHSEARLKRATETMKKNPTLREMRHRISERILGRISGENG